MNRSTKAVLAKGRLNLWLGTISLVVASCALVGCGDVGETESDLVASTSQALGARVGCPNSTYVALKTFYGYYCRPNTNSWMTCYSKTVTPEVYFKVFDNGDGSVSFQARDGANLSWKNYVSATNGGGGGLWHNAAQITSWEKFYPGVVMEYRTIATSGGYLITAENGGGSVMNANRPLSPFGAWEAFTVECY